MSCCECCEQINVRTLELRPQLSNREVLFLVQIGSARRLSQEVFQWCIHCVVYRLAFGDRSSVPPLTTETVAAVSNCATVQQRRREVARLTVWSAH